MYEVIDTDMSRLCTKHHADHISASMVYFIYGQDTGVRCVIELRTEC